MEKDTPINELLQKPIVAINIGVQDFAEALQDQGVRVVNVTWSPPAGGDAEMLAILEKLL
ncbi:MAG: hypothetical protein IIB30_03125 [Chloroflexi bacterium]|nr:hypothetical protein [Chloroflexota bacterium]MCH8225464.1 hypothetical protein [Chloroflexota bacterium]MCI0846804.1 hypothetical protein [Chloroflexota bacterium]